MRTQQIPRLPGQFALAIALTLMVPSHAVWAATRGVPAPFASIAAALAGSGPGDTVLVAAGTYSERSLALPAGVVIQGTDPGNVILDAETAARHFTVAAGETAAELHGLVLRNGTVRDRRSPDGGSILVSKEAALLVRECQFESPLASHFGGAIHVASAGSVTLEACTFTNATAHQIPRAGPTRRRIPKSQLSRGGAVYVDSDGSLTADRCVFTDSRAKDAGAAVYLSSGVHAELRQCEFQGGESLQGGAIASAGADLGLTDCSFSENAATIAYRNPGYGGALRLSDGGTTVIHGGDFVANHAGTGAAISAQRIAALEISGSRFTNNEANCGGGIHAIATPTTITGCGFLGNRAVGAPGGALFVASAASTVTSCTFHGNSSPKPGSAALLKNEEAPTVTGCIFSSNQGGAPIAGTAGAFPEISCSNLFGNHDGDATNELASQIGARGNISQNPRFVDADAGDFRLDPESPSANAGDCGTMGMPPVEEES